MKLKLKKSVIIAGRRDKNGRAEAVISTLEEKGFDKAQIADAMCDGEYLGKAGLTQDVVEDVYNICTAKKHKKTIYRGHS